MRTIKVGYTADSPNPKNIVPIHAIKMLFGHKSISTEEPVAIVNYMNSICLWLKKLAIGTANALLSAIQAQNTAVMYYPSASESFNYQLT